MLGSRSGQRWTDIETRIWTETDKYWEADFDRGGRMLEHRSGQSWTDVGTQTWTELDRCWNTDLDRNKCWERDPAMER